MKKIIISTSLILLVAFAQATNTTDNDSTKAVFYTAFDELKNMLEGTDSLNYEKAVFITENAYYNNAFSYDEFQQILGFHTKMIKAIAENAIKENQDKCKQLKLYQQKMFGLNALNWAIYKHITDTTFFVYNGMTFYIRPFSYTKDDPYGSNNWQNTQVINLLAGSNMKGNCYALASLFKIFSDRLQSDARLIVAPSHIYIQNRNDKGDYWNVELATKSFPGDGSIQTLTYTTHDLIMNGMSQRPLSNKDAVALNLIYLAKGFEHKFNDNTNDFLLQCAELAYKYDTLSLNALLLKAEVTENRLFAAMKENEITTATQARINPKTQKILTSYEKQLSTFYRLGYREIPKDIQHILLSAVQGNKDGYITTNKTPNPFRSIGQNQRYATLSWGLFDEIHPKVDIIQYFNASLNTKTNKVIEFLPVDTTNNYKVDPVVFAWSVDPMAAKYPGISPYVAFADNPIFFVDDDGREVKAANEQARTAILNTLTKEDMAFVKFDENGVIDKTLLNQASSNSGNLEALKQLVNDERTFNINVSDKFTYKNEKGDIVEQSLGPVTQGNPNEVGPFDPKTGEQGWLGVTQTPGSEPQKLNSPDENINITINSELSEEGQAENLAHEAYGHGYLYSKGEPYKHDPKYTDEGFKETNTQLGDQIKNRVNETEKNYNEKKKQ